MTKKEKRVVLKVLKKMLKNQDLFKTGLCSWIGELDNHDKIYNSEFWTVVKFIHRSKPVNYSNYWWSPGEIEPRITWIKEQIAILEEETQGFFTKFLKKIYGKS